MNVIFLDVDGVLTYAKYTNEKTKDIDIEKVKLLKRICDETNSGVVITSSWRGSEKYTPRIYDVLIEILTENGITILGDAPHISLELEDKDENYNKKYKIKFGTGRAAEVEKYVKDNNITNFVILDDEDFDWKKYGLHKRWVQSSYEGNGLEEKHALKAIEILKNKNNF